MLGITTGGAIALIVLIIVIVAILIKFSQRNPDDLTRAGGFISWLCGSVKWLFTWAWAKVRR